MKRITKITLSVLLLALVALGLAYYGQQADWFQGRLSQIGGLEQASEQSVTEQGAGGLEQSGTDTGAAGEIGEVADAACHIQASPTDNPLEINFVMETAYPDDYYDKWSLATGDEGEMGAPRRPAPLAQSRTHTYATTGNYTATLQILNAGVVLTECSTAVVVKTTPTAVCQIQAVPTAKPLEVKFVMETAFGEPGYYDTWTLSTGETTTNSQLAPIPQEKLYTYTKAGKYTAALELFKENLAGRVDTSLGSCSTAVVVAEPGTNTPVSMSSTAMYEDNTSFPGEAKVNMPITLQLDNRFTDIEEDSIDYTQILITKNTVPADLNTVTTPCEMDQFQHAINVKDNCYFFANPSKDTLENLLKEGDHDASSTNNFTTPTRFVRQATFAEYGLYYVTLVTREVYLDGTYAWRDNSATALRLELNPIEQYLHAPVISDLIYTPKLILPKTQEVSVKITDSANDFDLANSYIAFATQTGTSPGDTKPAYSCDIKSLPIKLPCYAALKTTGNTPNLYTITPINFTGLPGNFTLSVKAFDLSGAKSTVSANFQVSSSEIEDPPPVVNVFSMDPDQFVVNEIATAELDIRTSDAINLEDVKKTEVFLLDRDFTDENSAASYLLSISINNCNSTTKLPCKAAVNKIPLDPVEGSEGPYESPVIRTMFRGQAVFLPAQKGTFSALAIATDTAGQKGYKLHNFTVVGELEPPVPPVQISLNLNIPLQDRDTNPNSDRGTHASKVWLALYESTTSNPIYKQQVTTDQNGAAQINLGTFTPGKYIAVAKTAQHLAKGITINLVAGTNTVTFPNLLGGDVAGDPNGSFPGVYDDLVNSIDISQLFADWGSKQGAAYFNAEADLDANTEVGAEDFSTLISNANKKGDLRQ